VIVQPKVVDAGHHSRRLIRLTGLDVEENQARRLLNDLDSYRAKLGLGPQDEEIAAHRWVTERFERVMSAVPRELRGKLTPAEIFHEVLEHRWFMAERAQTNVDFGVAIDDYMRTILAAKPDEQSVLGSRAGRPSDDTAELRIVLPPE
jgi:DNA-binding transcriptional LysR family regulator